MASLSRCRLALYSQVSELARLPPTLWCIPAANTRDVLVLSRTNGTSAAQLQGREITGRWTHVALWRPSSRGPGALEHGAWTTLRIISHRCRVDADAEFWCYHAKDAGGRWDDPEAGPFYATNAGGSAVARVPWVSALVFKQLPSTHAFFDMRLKGPHLLSKDEQATLAARFCSDEPARHWFLDQQPGWYEVGVSMPMEILLPGHDRFVQRADKSPALIASIPQERFSPTRSRSFSLITKGGVVPLSGVVWARLTTGGWLHLATSSGRLQVCRADADSGRLTITGEHDLSTLRPDPSPPPKAALRGLKEPPPRKHSKPCRKDGPIDWV